MVRESEQQYWVYVTPLCMTEESDDSDTDKIITHKLLWRSDCKCVCVCGNAFRNSPLNLSDNVCVCDTP